MYAISSYASVLRQPAAARLSLLLGAPSINGLLGRCISSYAHPVRPHPMHPAPLLQHPLKRAQHRIPRAKRARAKNRSHSRRTTNPPPRAPRTRTASLDNLSSLARNGSFDAASGRQGRDYRATLFPSPRRCSRNNHHLQTSRARESELCETDHGRARALSAPIVRFENLSPGSFATGLHTCRPSPVDYTCFLIQMLVLFLPARLKGLC